MYHCMRCGEETWHLHEGTCMISEKGLDKRVPYMICDCCEAKMVKDDKDDPLSPEAVRQSKLDFVMWKIQSALDYAQQEGIITEYIGKMLDKLKSMQENKP